MFPSDSQWGVYDILDRQIDNKYLNRTFFSTVNGTCLNATDYFEIPLDSCVGPFGKPRPWGVFFISE